MKKEDKIFLRLLDDYIESAITIKVNKNDIQLSNSRFMVELRPPLNSDWVTWKERALYLTLILHKELYPLPNLIFKGIFVINSYEEYKYEEE